MKSTSAATIGRGVSIQDYCNMKREREREREADV
jgi:hypothetical protein